MPFLAFVSLLCLALLTPATAMGQSAYRVALIDPDAELLRAVTLSLEPWGVETVASDAPRPAASQPEAVQGARAVAAQLEVEGVVWITSTDQGSLLWVYDREEDEVTTRLLSETPPFDSAAAAAVALSIKTVLRPKVVEPPPAPPPPPPPPPKRPVEVAPPPRERSRPWSALELGAGGHWVEYRVEPRASLAALAWFALERRLGVGLHVSAGPGLRIDDARFRGRYREVVAGAGARLRFVQLPSASATLALGGSLRWTRLEGTVLQDPLPREVGRVNGSLDADVSGDVSVGLGLYLGASFGASYLPTYRRYFVEGVRVLSPGPLGARVGGHVGVELF